MWAPYLVHMQILMLDKQIEHAVDYFSQDQIKVVAQCCTYIHAPLRTLARKRCFHKVLCTENCYPQHGTVVVVMVGGDLLLSVSGAAQCPTNHIECV